VLAIIKESAGLVEDLVQVYAARGSLDQEKVQRALERIELQVKRGADLLTTLNRLAHTLDQDLSTVELVQEVEQLVRLSQRFARQKDQQVEAEGGVEEHRLVVNALRLHMALHEALMCCLEELPHGSTVTVGVHEEGGNAVAEFRSKEGGIAPGSPAEAGGWTKLESLSDALDARVERRPEGYGIRILLPKDTGAGGTPSGPGGHDHT
jgi:hypothetical protein